jgi:hypothetical protein
VLARISARNWVHWLMGTNRTVVTAQTSTQNRAAGRIRRARRAQNPVSDTRPLRSISRSSSDVIRKPEMTKKTSTPMKPPGTADGHRW